MSERQPCRFVWRSALARPPSNSLVVLGIPPDFAADARVAFEGQLARRRTCRAPASREHSNSVGGGVVCLGLRRWEKRKRERLRRYVHDPTEWPIAPIRGDYAFFRLLPRQKQKLLPN